MDMLITGSSGRIGTGLIYKFEEFADPSTNLSLLLNKNNLPTIDLAVNKVKAIESLDKGHYDVAIHLAANAEPMYCSRPENHDEVREINVGLTKKVCEVADRVILLSTDNVFEGSMTHDYSESDATCPDPHNFYGITKAEAEQVVLNNCGAVVRVQTMFGVSNRIVDNIIPALKGEEYLPFWDNDIVRPSHIDDLTSVLSNIILSGEGVYHVSCNGDALSRYQMAREFQKTALNQDLPVTQDALQSEPRGAGDRRLVLDSSITQEYLDLQFMDTYEAIRSHVKTSLVI